MRIGELATKAGVSARALRYYEEQALLTSQRSPSGQRYYLDNAIDRVQLIQQLYAAGLSSTSIRELLPCVVDGRATPALLDRLAAEKNHIAERIDDLTQARDRLETVLANATSNWRTGQRCRPE